MRSDLCDPRPRRAIDPSLRKAERIEESRRVDQGDGCAETGITVSRLEGAGPERGCDEHSSGQAGLNHRSHLGPDLLGLYPVSPPLDLNADPRLTVGENDVDPTIVRIGGHMRLIAMVAENAANRPLEKLRIHLQPIVILTVR